MNANGAHSNGTIRPVIKHVLMSGVEVQLVPLSPYLQRRLAQYATAQFPFDDTPWHKPLENALKEGQTYLDENDPEYTAAKAENTAHINRLYTELLVQETMRLPTSQEQLIKQHAERLEELRKYNTDDESDWDIVFWQILITSNTDIQLVVDVADSTAELTEVEVNDAIRIFRPALSRKRLLLSQR